MNFNYSIIIPFRNDLDLLSIACESIPDRSDIQVVIVDNSKYSLESSFKNRFKKTNIEYTTSSPKGGAGCARNVGLRHAKGKWLLFLDSDDYYTKGAFEVFDKHISDTDDVIYFKINSAKLYTGEPSNRHLRYLKQTAAYLKTDNDEYLRYAIVTPYCKMIRNQLVQKNNITFDEIRVSNDCMFSIRVGYAANTVKYVDEVCYCVTDAPANMSLMKIKDPEAWELRYRTAIREYKFLTNVGHIHARPKLHYYLMGAYKNYGIKLAIKFVDIAIKERVNLFICITDPKHI